MELKLKIALLILCIIFCLFIYKKIEKGKLQLKYSFAWYIVTIILAIFTIFDNWLIPLKNFLGFEETSNMIFLFGFLVLAMIIFSLSIKSSEANTRITRLTQELALLKKKVNNYKNQND